MLHLTEKKAWLQDDSYPGFAAQSSMPLLPKIAMQLRSVARKQHSGALPHPQTRPCCRPAL